MTIVETILDDGVHGAAVALIIVIAYKLYRAHITTDGSSRCCRCLRSHIRTENSGGEDIV
jgi:hypothetical protein